MKTLYTRAVSLFNLIFVKQPKSAILIPGDGGKSWLTNIVYGVNATILTVTDPRFKQAMPNL